MNIALYQGHFPVGAVEANASKIIEIAREAEAGGAAWVVFPELALSGYLPQDLLFDPAFRQAIEAALARLVRELPLGIVTLFGSPLFDSPALRAVPLAQSAGGVTNSAVMIAGGAIQAVYHKQALPQYGVFDEQRYFTPGNTPCVFEWQGQRIALLICEDIWQPEPIETLATCTPFDAIISIHASPFETSKREQRLARVAHVVARFAKPVIYLHQVGVQDELIYDGGSFIHTPEQGVCVLPQFASVLAYTSKCQVAPWAREFALTERAEQYEALCYALRGYVEHHHFPGVILGLSGGVDSALTLAIAVDALGPERVQAVLLPSRFTASMSIEDALAEADALSVPHTLISIESLFEEAHATLAPHFAHSTWDVTEENLQARLRGMILMALSNKSGKMVVTTTNKSELAVGYGTLYGDLAGGFALLKDVFKTDVYALARYRNERSPVIPERVLTRPPSAELRENQCDQDFLPEYAVLDQLIAALLAGELSPEVLTEPRVAEVVRLIRRNEYKRSQAPVGPKVSAHAFGRDWRMPIMQCFQ